MSDKYNHWWAFPHPIEVRGDTNGRFSIYPPCIALASNGVDYDSDERRVRLYADPLNRDDKRTLFVSWIPRGSTLMVWNGGRGGDEAVARQRAAHCHFRRRPDADVPHFAPFGSNQYEHCIETADAKYEYIVILVPRDPNEPKRRRIAFHIPAFGIRMVGSFASSDPRAQNITVTSEWAVINSKPTEDDIICIDIGDNEPCYFIDPCLE